MVDINLEKLLDAADTAKVTGDTYRAEELYRRVISDYVKAGKFIDAANVAEAAGFADQAHRLYQRVIDDHEKAGRFSDAADVASGISYKRAIDNYVKVYG